jgi:hypothetical protein
MFHPGNASKAATKKYSLADCGMAVQPRGKNGAGWALRSRLEKQPTDLRRRHHYMRDGTLVLNRHALAVSRRFQDRERDSKRPDPVFAGCKRLALTTHGGIKVTHLMSV